jgi:non-canonical purine NTP pyrophosphatase (RdgB/HAM1 family)
MANTENTDIMGNPNNTENTDSKGNPDKTENTDSKGNPEKTENTDSKGKPDNKGNSENMENQENRAAKFVCSIACVMPNGDVITADGEVHGVLLREPRGSGGFGYDPIFYVPELGVTTAEMTMEDKNKISHRGRALRALKEKLNLYLENKL